MKVLVLGGAGFLGFTLVKKLLLRGDDVVLVDLEVSLKENFNISLLKDVSKSAEGTLFIIASSVGELCQSIIEGGATPYPIDDNISIIFNLATRASVNSTLNDPVGMSLNILDGTKSVLDASLVLNASVLHTSTSEMYGDPLEPQHESYTGNVDPMDLRSAYSEAKRMSETLCMAYNHQRGADARVVRIFNSYGPGMSLYDGRVVASFFRAYLSHATNEIGLNGGGAQSRSFCFVEDTIDGFLALMDLPRGGFKGPVNIGNPHGLKTMRELLDAQSEVVKVNASKIESKLGKINQVIVEETPMPNADPATRKPVITTAKLHLGWEPKTPFWEGINKYLDYCILEEEFVRNLQN